MSDRPGRSRAGRRLGIGPPPPRIPGPPHPDESDILIHRRVGGDRQQGRTSAPMPVAVQVELHRACPRRKLERSHAAGVAHRRGRPRRAVGDDRGAAARVPGCVLPRPHLDLDAERGADGRATRPRRPPSTSRRIEMAGRHSSTGVEGRPRAVAARAANRRAASARRRWALRSTGMSTRRSRACETRPGRSRRARGRGSRG